MTMSKYKVAIKTKYMSAESINLLKWYISFFNAKAQDYRNGYTMITTDNRNTFQFFSQYHLIAQ